MQHLLWSVILLVFLSACAQKSVKNETQITDSETIPQEVSNKYLDTQGQVPACEGCILGSSVADNPAGLNKRVYFLYGAEHLGLKNMYFDIPVVYNDAVKKWLDYFTGRGRELFIRYTQRAGMYAPVLSKILHEDEMPRDLIYLAMAESGFHNKAKSWAKAVGPWQFMPYTGKKFGLNIDFYVDERRDPIKATHAASRYLKTLYELFGNWELAMASYNAGEGKIKRAIKRYNTNNFWELRNGRYLKAETKNYVPKIMALAILGKNLESFGFTNINFDEHLNFDEVEVASNQDLYLIADALGIEFDELHYLNPELQRWQTPNNDKNYVLRIPPGMKSKWSECCQMSSFTAQNYQNYVVKSSGSLHQIAKNYKVPVEVLVKINGGMNPNQRLSRGQNVFLPFRDNHHQKHHLYADLYDRPRRVIRRRNSYSNRVNLAMRRGLKIKNPTQYYTVQKGDSLWSISRKMGVSLDTLIKTNAHIVKKRMPLPGDRLAVR
jgi:membrane-bound lytic murein transglycosylase D